MKRMDEEDWRAIPGGAALIAHFGHIPMFHDGEITQVVLNRLSTSTISIHIWGVDDFGPAKHAVVTLQINDILDLQLENFSPQNVIGDLIIRALPQREDRRAYYSRDPKDGDVEIELIPIFGLNGSIRAGLVSLAFVPGMPQDA